MAQITADIRRSPFTELAIREIESVHKEVAENWRVLIESEDFQAQPQLALGGYSILLSETFRAAFREDNANPEEVLEEHNQQMFLIGDSAEIYRNDLAPEFLPEIEPFADSHNEVYQNLAFQIIDDYVNQRITKEELATIVMGPMFCGKNTFAAWLYKYAVEAGLEVEVLVFYGLGEEQILARSLQNPKYGNDHWHLDATPYGSPVDTVIPTKTGKMDVRGNQTVIDELLSKAPDLVIFDEASFADSQAVLDLKFSLYAKGIPLVLMGLDQNYMGLKLPTFTQAQVMRGSRILRCKSFIPFRSIAANGPDATVTLRHQLFGYNSKNQPVYGLDIGGGRLNMSKALRFCIYRPGLENNSPRELLKEYDSLYRALAIPNQQLLEEQKAWYKRMLKKYHPEALSE